jgi:multiple sugar transport system permease protein
MTTQTRTQQIQATTVPPRRRSAGGLSGHRFAGPLFASPALLGLAIFLVAPFVLALVLSFYRVQLNSPRPARFVGFEQYTRLFTDPDLAAAFGQALLNNFTFALIVVPVQTVLALALAVLVNRKLRGMVIFRTFIFMPLVFPLALTAVIWRLIYSRGDQGLLNAILGLFSGGSYTGHDWLGDPSTALGSIIVMSIWQSVSFQMIIVLAALQSVPTELYEAASLDRANKWAQFLNVTVPGIRNTLIFVALITTIFSFRLFDQVYLLSRSGSVDRASTETVMTQIINTGFDNNNVGQAAATVIFMLIITVMQSSQRRSASERRLMTISKNLKSGRRGGSMKRTTPLANRTSLFDIDRRFCSSSCVYYLIVGSFRVFRGPQRNQRLRPHEPVLGQLRGCLRAPQFRGHRIFRTVRGRLNHRHHRGRCRQPRRELHGGLLLRPDAMAGKEGPLPAGDCPDHHPVRSRRPAPVLHVLQPA